MLPEQPARRDPRLDVFRGLAMAIILVAHVPGNPLTEFIPARFGPSDAAEMFVFCSGFASALAFGATFRRAGFALGTLRIAHRCWQVYWSHLGLFLTVASLCVLGTWWTEVTDYVDVLYLQHFFAEPRQGLVHGAAEVRVLEQRRLDEAGALGCAVCPSAPDDVCTRDAFGDRGILAETARSPRNR